MRLPHEPLRPKGGFVGPLKGEGEGGGKNGKKRNGSSLHSKSNWERDGEMFVDVGAYGTPKVGEWLNMQWIDARVNFSVKCSRCSLSTLISFPRAARLKCVHHDYCHTPALLSASCYHLLLLSQAAGFEARKSCRVAEDFVRSVQGYQMMYADTYMDRAEFRAMFDHAGYDALRKSLPHCEEAFPEVFDKVGKHNRI